MLTTADATTLYAHVAMHLGDADTPVWDTISKAKKAKYRAAVKALVDIPDPLDRAAALHAAIGDLWGAPAWDAMQGPERAAYMFAAGNMVAE